MACSTTDLAKCCQITTSTRNAGGTSPRVNQEGFGGALRLDDCDRLASVHQRRRELRAIQRQLQDMNIRNGALETDLETLRRRLSELDAENQELRNGRESGTSESR